MPQPRGYIDKHGVEWLRVSRDLYESDEGVISFTTLTAMYGPLEAVY